MAQSWAAKNQAQDHKWPIPLDNLLAGSVSPAYQNLSPVAHHISPGRASKDGRLEEILYIEYALMQQPSHVQCVATTQIRWELWSCSEWQLWARDIFLQIRSDECKVSETRCVVLRYVWLY